MVTLESLLFLVFGLFAGRVFSAGFIGGYFHIIDKFFLKWSLTPVGFFIDVVSIIGFLWSIWRARKPWSDRQKYRYYLTLGCIIVGGVMLFQISGRAIFGYMFGAHDGVVQTEAAANFLLHGKNPYSESYAQTLFETFHENGTTTPKPIMFYYPYPPLIPLTAATVVWLSNLEHVRPDARLVTMTAFIGLCVVLLWFFRDDRIRLWLVLGLMFNPLAFGHWMLGMNDILFVLFLVIAALGIHRRAWALSGVMIGLAICSKQTAVIALPLWGWMLWLEYRKKTISWNHVWRAAGCSLGVIAVFYLPFLLWNAPAMFDDLVRYVAGSIPNTYSIAGDSLWQILVIFRIVPDSWAATPHSWLVLPVTAAGLGITAWWLTKRPTASQWLVSIAAIILLMGLVHRYFFENYLAATLLLLIPAVALDRQAPSTPTRTTTPV